jgi:uncharacterized oxidoreductase
MPTIASPHLYELARRVVRAIGSAEEEAHEVADHLVRANLAGHDSHGVGMLPGYVRIWQHGLLVPNQSLASVLDSGPLLVLDAQRGFGQRMAAEAVRRAIARARDIGACVLALRNSAHVGRIGTYGELCAAEGMAFTAFVNVADDPLLQAPWGCRDPRLGTNPFCTAVPAADGAPFLLDMATTTIAFGKARVAANKGVPVPDDAIIDADGNPISDPADLVREHLGALTSFGRHKGSGLAIACEVMAGALAGGQRADQPKRGGIVNSLLAIVIDVAQIGDPAQIRADVATIGAHIKESRTAPAAAEILIPGEPERRIAAERRRDGVPIDERSLEDIMHAAAAVGIDAGEIAAILAGRAP